MRALVKKGTRRNSHDMTNVGLGFKTPREVSWTFLRGKVLRPKCMIKLGMILTIFQALCFDYNYDERQC